MLPRRPFAPGPRHLVRGPVRVKLSPEVWQDHYQSRARCRTILLDLLGGAGPALLKGERSVGYTIQSAEN